MPLHVPTINPAKSRRPWTSRCPRLHQSFSPPPSRRRLTWSCITVCGFLLASFEIAPSWLSTR